MRRTNPMSILSTTPRRLLAAFLALIMFGVVAQLTIVKASGLLSGTATNSGNTYAASSCFLPVPVSMVGGNLFSPASLTVKAGCSVKWTNTTSTSHNTISNTNVWVSPNPMGLNATYTYQFNSTGSFPYKCTRHPGGMLGTITVN